jgi:hypothetical protein
MSACNEKHDATVYIDDIYGYNRYTVVWTNSEGEPCGFVCDNGKETTNEQT